MDFLFGAALIFRPRDSSTIAISVSPCSFKKLLIQKYTSGWFFSISRWNRLCTLFAIFGSLFIFIHLKFLLHNKKFLSTRNFYFGRRDRGYECFKIKKLNNVFRITAFLIRGIRRPGVSSFGEVFGGLIIRGDGFGGILGNLLSLPYDIPIIFPFVEWYFQSRFYVI